MQSSRVAKWRKKKNQRGSMTLETLVLAPVLIFQLGVSFWAYQLYESKIDTMKRVRGPVFSSAAFGCGNAGSTSFEAPTGEPNAMFAPNESDAPLEGAEGVDLGVVGRKLPQAPGADILDRAIDSKAARLARPFVSNGFVGAPTVKLGAHASMMCNEAVRDGDPKAMKAVSANGFDPRSP
jgi:hypothetical protein